MTDFRGKPSQWLLNNSSGYPDFLFTILTYSMLLLIFISLVWISFGVLTFIHAGSQRGENILKIMESMRVGMISLAGVVFGLAGSYTVRRFKKDEHYLEKRGMEHEQLVQAVQAGNGGSTGLDIVQDEEDI